MPALTTTDLTAFCSTCPAAAEVTEALTLLGFALVFQLDADDNQAYLHLAPLPPQFHYRNDHGTEVVYLAGVEQEDKQPAPQHASRFWLYVGANANAQEQAAEVLAAIWSLRWFPLDEVPIEDHTPLKAVA